MFRGLRSFAYCSMLALLAFLLASTLKSIHTFVVLPSCTIPGLRQTEFCTIVSRTTIFPRHNVKTAACKMPLFSHLFICPSRSNSSSAQAIPKSLDVQFNAYQELVASTLATPVFGREIREIVLSLDDMVVLLKATSFKNKDAILAHLGSIRRASRESARRLQKYTAKLLSSISLILTSSEYTIEIAGKRGPANGWRSFWMDTRTESDVQEAFFHTIRTFETLNRQLAHLNGETQESITILDGYIEVLVDLIYDDALMTANRELAEILSKIWTRLGGHRTQLEDAMERVQTLKRVGQGTRAMRAFVLDVQLRLEQLQTGAEELRAQASEPLLVAGPIPITNVIESLKEGCSMLKDELWATTSRLHVEA